MLNLSQDEKLLSLPVWMLGQEQGELVALLGRIERVLICNGTADIVIPAMQSMIFDVVNKLD